MAGIIFGLLLAIIGTFLLFLAIEDGIFFIGAFICYCFSVGCFMSIDDKPEPTIKDVMEKRARVVETQIITEGDTVRTYKMIWNENKEK